MALPNPRFDPKKKTTRVAAGLHALIIACFNLGLRCQTLKYEHPDGKKGKSSEDVTVARMIKAGAPKNGKNAAEYMAGFRVDILGVQELVKDNGKTFTRFMNDERCKHGGKPGEYGFYQPGGDYYSCGIIYRKETVGEVEHLSVKSAEDVRSAAAVYFPRLQLVFLSIWLGHEKGAKIRSLESLDDSLRASLGARPVSRVITVMDSNDFHGSELHEGTRFTLARKPLRFSGKPCFTCAEDKDFKGRGDMMFDSGDPADLLDHGVPDLPGGQTPWTQLLSDHLPVMAAVKVKEFKFAPAPRDEFFVINRGRSCFLDSHGEKVEAWGDGVNRGGAPDNLKWQLKPITGEPDTYHIVHVRSKKFLLSLDGEAVSLCPDAAKHPDSVKWRREPVAGIPDAYYLIHKGTKKFLDSHGVPKDKEHGWVKLWGDGDTANKGGAPINLQWQLQK